MIVRALGVSLLLAVSQAAQPPLDLCAENSQSGRERHCEVREEILTGQKALDVDPGRNGGVQIRGWSSQDVRLRTRVEGYADAASRARALVSAVRVTSLAGRLRTDGPMAPDNENWSTYFYLDVPANTQLAINTNNGGISLEEFSGAAVLRATNGSIRLRAAAGDIRGRTENGGLHIELAGPSLGRRGSRRRDAKRIRPSLAARQLLRRIRNGYGARPRADRLSRDNPFRPRAPVHRDAGIGRTEGSSGHDQRVGLRAASITHWHFPCSTSPARRRYEQGKGSNRLHSDVGDGRAGDIALYDLPAARLQLVELHLEHGSGIGKGRDPRARRIRRSAQAVVVGDEIERVLVGADRDVTITICRSEELLVLSHRGAAVFAQLHTVHPAHRHARLQHGIRPARNAVRARRINRESARGDGRTA